ncbi:hypothetical protein MU0083_001196 [[Mycobacterium] kokjensenii]|uniref:Uncharacterized protein n=1 Tax=[Mycobacterium] kokjensenii TaxID=3064287 RepID=A0ABM9LA77_9MYCO|nr:hypothetical protein [Mycolicibacter sp. MU0083]CAJ1495585.1 hypothetical protein MU0083_001196 [Mycolicibacter sp. MU0083]
MLSDEQQAAESKPRPVRSLAVRVAAARAAVTASKKTGRPVEPFVQELAETDLPGNPYVPFVLPSRWRRFISALWPNL